MSEPRISLKPKIERSGFFLQAVDFAIIVAVLWTTSTFFYKAEPYYFVASIAVALGFLIFAYQGGLYSADSGQGWAGTAIRIFQTWATVILLGIFVAYLSKTSELFSRAAVSIWIVAVPCLMCVPRILLGAFSRKSDPERAAIVGLNSTAVNLVRTIGNRPELGIVVEGIYDNADSGAVQIPGAMDIHYAGNYSKLACDARSGCYDSIYIASLPEEAELRALIHNLADCQVKLKYIPNVFIFNLLNSRISDIGGVPCINVYDSPLDGQGAFIKRLEDIVLGSAILALIAIPLVVIACAVKLSGPGPVIFRQKRYGLNGEEFLVWKFRTMTVCEDGSAVVQARKDDQRVTRVGKFLRRTSMDELPQFLNVLRGSMSIVGPRPHPVALNEHFRGEIDGYMLRHLVKPGITGWAQVNGWRGETETLEKMEKRVQYDLYYIRNWSPWFDLRIIAITLIKGFSGKNAY